MTPASKIERHKPNFPHIFNQLLPFGFMRQGTQCRAGIQFRIHRQQRWSIKRRMRRRKKKSSNWASQMSLKCCKRKLYFGQWDVYTASLFMAITWCYWGFASSIAAQSKRVKRFWGSINKVTINEWNEIKWFVLWSVPLSFDNQFWLLFYGTDKHLYMHSHCF